MSARYTAAVLGALGLFVAGCNKPAAPARSEPTAPAPPPKPVTPGSEASAPRSPGPEAQQLQLPVPEAVARLHRKAFAPTEDEAKLGGVVCLVTLHEAALERGPFHPLVLFGDGSVATWRQTPTGNEDPFFAKLSAEEQARASKLVDAIPEGRALARQTFDASALVMGVSRRVGDQVETLYFDNGRIPAALGQLVSLLKQRLEATNRPP